MLPLFRTPTTTPAPAPTTTGSPITNLPRAPRLVQILAALTSLALACALIPSAAHADDEPISVNVLQAASLMTTASTSSSSSGFVLEKSISTSEDGTQTITLEAYVDSLDDLGSTSTPCDIVLVLDQSGSMASDFETSETYTELSGLTNSELEDLADEGTLYTLLDDGTYTEVTITSSGSRYYYTWEELSGSYYSRQQNAVPDFDGVTFYLCETTSITHLDALKIAVTSFIESIREDSYGADGIAGTSDDVDHRIAIVGFAYNEQYSYGNTELFIGSTSYTYNNGSSSAQNFYRSALQDITTNQGYSNLLSSIDQLDAEGGTFINYGLEMAEGIFEANPLEEDENRNRVTLVLTDGSPGMYGGDYDVADLAIEQAALLKSDEILSTVYSIGIFSGADASSGLIAVDSTWDTQESNLFMHLLSSDYPDATSMSTTGSRYVTDDGTSPSYYLSAADSESLTTIFESISNEVGGIEVSPGEAYFLRDILAEGYTLPDGVSVEDITVSTQAYLGEEDGWADPVVLDDAVVTIEGNVIEVTGFDFADQWVYDDESGAYGSKIVVEIPVESTATWGGTSYTNEEGSGIYTTLEETLLDSFESPVDSPSITYSIETTKDLIYLGNTTDISDNLLWTEDNQPNGVNNAFVNITYEIEANNTTYTCFIPAGTDTTASDYVMLWTDPQGAITTSIDVLPTTSGEQSYTLTCTVADSWTDGEAQESLVIEKVILVEAVACSLTITKQLDSESAYQNDYFIIRLIQDEETEEGYASLLSTYPDATNLITGTLEVVVQEGDSLTISELPLGTYLIEEDQAWSWRYSFVSAQADNASAVEETFDYGVSVTLPTDQEVSATNAHVTLTFTNSPLASGWLSSESIAVNLFTVTDEGVAVGRQD